MKKIYNLFLLFLLGLTAFSCSEEKDPIYDNADGKASTLDAINGDYVLNAANDNFATFKFSKADFGVNVATQYTIQASLTQEFTEAKDLESNTYPESGFLVTSAKMNAALLGWDATPGTPVTVYFRTMAYVLNLSSKPTAMVLYSNVISSSITPFSGEKEYPKVWIIGDYCGWSHDKSQFLFSFASNDTYQAIVDFGEKAASGFKVTGIAGWDDSCNWGTDGNATAPEAEASSIPLISSGGSSNISCYSNRFYRLKFSTTTLVLSKDLSFKTLSIVGDAGSQVSGWGGAEVDLNFDTTKQRFWADVEFANGEFKFRTDHDWGTSFGSKTEGKLDGGDNIKVSAGKYRVYVNISNPDDMTYELNAKDYGK